MPAPEDTLAAIDDILDGWHGSPDAATWTAEPPKWSTWSTLSESPRLEANLDGTWRAGETFATQLRPAVEQMIRDVGASWRALAGTMDSPQMRELLESRRRARRAMKSEYARRRRRR